jgi:hypothetical protein
VSRRRPTCPTGTTLAARIAFHEQALVELRRRQRDEADGRFLRVLLIGTNGEAFNLALLRLRAALDADLREALGARRPRQVGQRLCRLKDRTLDGLVLRRVNRDEAGCNWQVEIT